MLITTVRCRQCGMEYYFYFLPCCPECGSEKHEIIKTEKIKPEEERGWIVEETV